jgi:ankyrin repeat protein
MTMETQAFLDLIAAGNRDAVLAAVTENPELKAARTKDGASAAQWACYTGHPELASELLAEEVDPATACTVGRADLLPEILNPNQRGQDGFALLPLALAFGHNDVARKLIALGADPNYRSTTLGNVAAIHAAVFGRNLDGLKLAVEAGADVNLTQEGGFTALMGAAQNGDAEMVRYLLDRGADKAATTDEGKTAMDLAANDDIRRLLA